MSILLIKEVMRLKMQGYKVLSSFIKFIIIALMVSDVLVMASLPWTLQWLMSVFYEGNIAKMYAFYMVILYVFGILMLFILNELRVIFNSVEKSDPFILRNVTALKRISKASMITCIIFLVKTFAVNSLMTMVSLFVFFIASLFCTVLAEVFKKAVEYKNDHDLTI